MDPDYTIEKLQQEINDGYDSDKSEGWKQRMLKEKMAAMSLEAKEMKDKLME